MKQFLKYSVNINSEVDKKIATDAEFSKIPTDLINGNNVEGKYMLDNGTKAAYSKKLPDENSVRIASHIYV